jgi:hypothetical protein
MPFVEEITSTKPDGVSWFRDQHPDIHRDIHVLQDSVKDQYGYIETELSHPTENITVTKRSFIDAEAHAKFLEFMISSPPHQIRYQYNLENGISWTSEFHTT